MKSSIQVDALFEQVMANLPPATVATLTATQLEDLNTAFQQLKWKKHSIDWRASVPFPGKGFYVVFLAGPERRSAKRLRAENPNNPGGIIAAVLATAVTIGTVATVALIPMFQPRLVASEIEDAHPTVLPWLQTQDACERDGRTWEDGACWDNQHDPDF